MYRNIEYEICKFAQFFFSICLLISYFISWNPNQVSWSKTLMETTICYRYSPGKDPQGRRDLLYPLSLKNKNNCYNVKVKRYFKNHWPRVQGEIDVTPTQEYAGLNHWRYANPCLQSRKIDTIFVCYMHVEPMKGQIKMRKAIQKRINELKFV